MGKLPMALSFAGLIFLRFFALQQFLPQDTHLLRGLDPQAHLSPVDVRYRDDDIRPDENPFAQVARQDEHVPIPPFLLNGGRVYLRGLSLENHHGRYRLDRGHWFNLGLSMRIGFVR